MAKNPAGLTRGSWLNRSGCWGAVTAVGKHNSPEILLHFRFFFNWESPNFSALGIQIEDMVKANPMELPKCRGAGGSDLWDSADATQHQNPAGGQNPALCYLALKITWKRKSRDLYPCGVLWGVWKKVWMGFVLKTKISLPCHGQFFGISYSSPVYLSWKTTNILEDVALTDEGITSLH